MQSRGPHRDIPYSIVVSHRTQRVQTPQNSHRSCAIAQNRNAEYTPMTHTLNLTIPIVDPGTEMMKSQTKKIGQAS